MPNLVPKEYLSASGDKIPNLEDFSNGLLSTLEYIFTLVGVPNKVREEDLRVDAIVTELLYVWHSRGISKAEDYNTYFKCVRGIFETLYKSQAISAFISSRQRKHLADMGLHLINNSINPLDYGHAENGLLTFENTSTILTMESSEVPFKRRAGTHLIFGQNVSAEDVNPEVSPMVLDPNASSVFVYKLCSESPVDRDVAFILDSMRNFFTIYLGVPVSKDTLEPVVLFLKELQHSGVCFEFGIPEPRYSPVGSILDLNTSDLLPPWVRPIPLGSLSMHDAMRILVEKFSSSLGDMITQVDSPIQTVPVYKDKQVIPGLLMQEGPIELHLYHPDVARRFFPNADNNALLPASQHMNYV